MNFQAVVVAVLAQSFAAMIAVVAAYFVAGDRSTVTVQQTLVRDSGLREIFLGVFRG